jgi:nucleoside 2-deoxyribosyltransferase
MQIFISYDHSDQWFVDLLTQAMQAHQYEPLVYNLKNQYNEKVFDRIYRALRNCDHAITVFSKAYAESEWFEQELVALWMIEKREGNPKPNFILPVYLEDCRVPAFIRSRPHADFKDRSRDNRSPLSDEEFRRITSLIVPKPQQAFVIMKFTKNGEETRELDAALEEVYNKAIHPVLREFRYEVIKVDEIRESNKKITDQILLNLERCEVVIADLTGERPNCYYEAGYAHALGKDMILTIRKGDPIHFDVADYRFIEWKDANHLANELRKFLSIIQEKNLKPAP